MSSCRFISDISIYLILCGIDWINFCLHIRMSFPQCILNPCLSQAWVSKFASKTFKFMMSCPLAGDSPKNHAWNSLPLNIYNKCIILPPNHTTHKVPDDYHKISPYKGRLDHFNPSLLGNCWQMAPLFLQRGIRWAIVSMKWPWYAATSRGLAAWRIKNMIKTEMNNDPLTLGRNVADTEARLKNDIVHVLSIPETPWLWAGMWLGSARSSSWAW